MEEPWKAVGRRRVGADQGEWSPRTRQEIGAGTGNLSRFKRGHAASLAVHQLVPLLPEEEVMVDNISLSPGAIPTGPASIIWGRAKQKRGAMVQGATVLCLFCRPG